MCNGVRCVCEGFYLTPQLLELFYHKLHCKWFLRRQQHSHRPQSQCVCRVSAQQLLQIQTSFIDKETLAKKITASIYVRFQLLDLRYNDPDKLSSFIQPSCLCAVQRSGVAVSLLDGDLHTAGSLLARIRSLRGLLFGRLVNLPTHWASAPNRNQCDVNTPVRT